MEGGPQVSITELRAYVASNEYGAELALQHAMRLLAGMEQERALADRLAAYLEAMQYQYAPIVAQRGVAAWKEARP
jgi:hypothetical protein